MDNRVKHQRIAYYDKEYEQQVQAVTAQVTNKLLANLSTEALKTIASHINQAWRMIAAKKLARAKSHYLPEYVAGISDVNISGNTVKLKLRTFDAVKIELGWAPPQNRGSTMADGIGKYDNHPHDMRPMLLWSGAQPKTRITKTRGNRKKHLAQKLGKGKWHTATRSGAMHWKVIKLELAEQNLTGLTSEVTKWMYSRTMDLDGQRLGYKSNKAMKEMRQGAPMIAEARGKLWISKMRRLEEQLEKSPIGKESVLRFTKDEEGLLPKTGTVLWHETMSNRFEVTHRNFLFQRLRAKKTGKSKYSFHLFRTISDSESQISKQRWFSNGTPPAHIIFGDPDGDDLASEIARLVATVGIPTVLKKEARQPSAPAQIKVAAPAEPEPQVAVFAPVTTTSGNVATTQLSAGTFRRRRIDEPITPAAVVASAVGRPTIATPTPVAPIVAPPAPVAPVTVQAAAPPAQDDWKAKMMAEILEARAAKERLSSSSAKIMDQLSKSNEELRIVAQEEARLDKNKKNKT